MRADQVLGLTHGCLLTALTAPVVCPSPRWQTELCYCLSLDLQVRGRKPDCSTSLLQHRSVSLSVLTLVTKLFLFYVCVI